MIRYRVSSLSRIATIAADGELQMRFATPVDLRIVSSALAGKSNAMSDRGRGCLLPGAEAAAHREAALCGAVSRLG